jgi:hypothetical protein
MQKSETALAALRARASLLADKRIGAQAALETAMAARQATLLAGDLDDLKLAAKLQTAVDGAQSALTGLDDAISALQVQIDSAEQDLTAERERVERQAASESLAASVASIEAKLEPWLTTTRAFAESLQSIAHVRFEPGQIATYIGGCAGQAEIALAVMLDDLHRLVPAIAAGHEPIPRDPEIVTPAPAAVAPVVQRVWTVKPIKFKQEGSGQRIVDLNEQIDLSPELAKRAVALGAAVFHGDKRFGKQVGSWRRHHGFGGPPLAQCVMLDDESQAAAAEEQSRPEEPHQVVLHSAADPNFQVVDRGPGYVLKTSGPAEAA